MPEQELPNPNFTTVGYPNPEDVAAFKLAEELGKRVDAELLIATDPDRDRMAIEVKKGEVRDKDGISVTMYICEAAAYYKKKGKTLLQTMNDLYNIYGHYRESQVSLIMEGERGSEQIRYIMNRFRHDRFEQFGDVKVIEKIDYMNGYQEIGKSNVLKFLLEDENWFALRLSGTEPKMKFYFYSKGIDEKEAVKKLEKMQEEVMHYVDVCRI